MPRQRCCCALLPARHAASALLCYAVIIAMLLSAMPALLPCHADMMMPPCHCRRCHDIAAIIHIIADTDLFIDASCLLLRFTDTPAPLLILLMPRRRHSTSTGCCRHQYTCTVHK